MTNLKAIRVDAPVTAIGDYTFANCSKLADLNMPRATYVHIPNYAFANDVSLPEIEFFTPWEGSFESGTTTVKSIGVGGLMGTSITRIDLTKYDSLGDYALANCKQLRSVDFTNTSDKMKVGSHLFEGCDHLGENPETDKVILTNYLTPYMFKDCTLLTGVDISPVTIKTGIIPEGVFMGCVNLKPMKTEGGVYDSGIGIDPLRSEVKSIGNDAFNGCKSLTYIGLPETLISIGKRAFRSTGLESIRIPRTVTMIPAG